MEENGLVIFVFVVAVSSLWSSWPSYRQMAGCTVRIVYFVAVSGRRMTNLGSMLGFAGMTVIPQTTFGLTASRCCLGTMKNGPEGGSVICG